MFSEMQTDIFTGEITLSGICFKIVCKNKNARVHMYWNAQNGTLIPPNAGEDVEQQELSFIAGGNAKWCSHFGSQFGNFLKNSTYTYHTISNHGPWYLPKGVENFHPHKKLHMDIYSSFIHNCQNLEATKMSFSR